MTTTTRPATQGEVAIAAANTRRASSRWVFELGFALGAVSAAALILSVVGRRPGWPLGQQFFNELILVRLYAAHFRHFDFFPVWSSTDGLGLGTPVLLYYQKAFFYVAAPLFILLGSLKAALVTTIGLFLVVGAYGMRLALRRITDSKMLLVAGSLGFLFTNYVFTDWLVRGDLPEFTAMMVVPWLLWWCLTLVKERRASLLLIIIIPLLVDAHNAIALVGLFAMIVAGVVFLTTAGLAGLRGVALRLAIGVGGAIVLLAPTLLAELRFSDAFDPASKVKHFTSLSRGFKPFGSYFVTSYRWLSSQPRLDLQLDYALWIPIAVAVVALFAYWTLVPRARRRFSVGAALHLPSIAFLLISAGIYLFLQLRVSLFVYDLVSPLQSIDYPWRMMAMLTPIGVVLVVAVAEGLRQAVGRHAVAWLAVLWLTSLIVLSPLTSSWTTEYGSLARRGQFPSTALSAPPTFLDYATFRGLFAFRAFLFPEYLPKVFTKSGELYDDSALYHTVRSMNYGMAPLTAGAHCRVRPPNHSPLESLNLSFVVTCDRSTALALPVTYNSFSSVFVKGSDGRVHSVPVRHVPSDPRLVVSARAGTTTFDVHLPTLWGILGVP